MKLYPVEVLERRVFGSHTLLRYRWEGKIPEPGQFVVVRPAGYGGAAQTLDPFLPRPFFVHDHADGVASLLVVARGRATRMLSQPDAGLAVSAPLGRGFRVEDGGRYALLGGGVWVSPLKLLSRRLEERGRGHEVFLEIPEGAAGGYAEGIKSLFPGANLVRTGADALTLVDYLGDPSSYSQVCASGPPTMLSSVAEGCSGRTGAQLALRETMACASGSCYGCAVPVWRAGEVGYARACIEGPVFRAEDLAW